MQKSPWHRCQRLSCICVVASLSAFGLNFVSLHAFLALHRNEGNFLTFFQALEAVTLNGAEVYEQIRPALRSDKTKTFFRR